MRSYSDLVNKYFKVYKKRSILTVLGIISSIILFFTIGYTSNYLRDVELVSGISIRGDYDAAVLDVNKNEAEKIKSNLKVDKSGYYSLVTQIKVNLGNVERNMPIYKIDDDTLDNILYERVNIEEGRRPNKYNEIMVTSSLKKQIGIKLNDKFNISDVSYTIVGFYDEDYNSGYNDISGITYLDEGNMDKNINVIFKVKNKNNKIKSIKSILKDSGAYQGDIYDTRKVHLNYFMLGGSKMQASSEDIDFNEDVVTYIALNLFVLILTIVMTYGSINISLNERKKEFAVLRCIGATPSKIKRLLIKESLILGILSLVPGIIIAQIISWIIVYTLLKASGYTEYNILIGKMYISVIINTVVFIGVNILFSTVLPLKNVGKISPIDIIKNKDSNKQNISRRKSILIRRIFGYSGELAYKNIRTNNKKFITTIVTLSMILVATIGFGGYKTINQKYIEEGIKGLTDVGITFYPDRNSFEEPEAISDILQESERFIKGLRDLQVDKEMYISLVLYGGLILEGTELDNDINGKYYVENINLNNQKSIYTDSANFLVLDNAYINKILPYIQSEGNKVESLKDNEFIVLQNRVMDRMLKVNKVNPLTLQTGDNVQCYLSGYKDIDEAKKTKPITLNYKGTIDSKHLIGSNRMSYNSNLTIVVSEDFFSDRRQIENIGGSMLSVSLDIDENQNKEVAIKSINDYVSINDAHYILEKSQEINFKEKSIAFNNIAYLALGLIILISSVNLINTRIINISLRDKEFKVYLAVGMKKSNLKKMILLEGIIEWFISSVIGGMISIILLIGIKAMHSYEGYLDGMHIPYHIVLGGIFILFLITIVISLVPYRRFKNIDLNDLIKEE